MPSTIGSAPHLPNKGVNDAVSLTAGAVTDAVAHSVNLAAVKLPRPKDGIIFELDLTAAAAASGDTLDAAVQTSIDGTNYVDVCYFTQMLGNGGTKRYFAKLMTQTAQAMFENATALTAGNIRHLFGDWWRVRYTIADGGAHGQTFTFQVWANPF